VRPRLEPIPRKWLKACAAAEYANQRGYLEVAVEMVRANVTLDLLRAYAVGTGTSTGSESTTSMRGSSSIPGIGP
jgi:hypothetical protein